MDSRVEHRTLAVDGVRSPVLVAGPPGAEAREAVVFVHGNNAGAKWDRLLAPVAGVARVIAPEMPGFGAADKPSQWPYTVAAYAAHLDARSWTNSASNERTWWPMISAGRGHSPGPPITSTRSPASP